MAPDDRDETLQRSLARLGAATAEISPDERLTDAVMARLADTRAAADPLAGIARATASLDSADALTGAVMARVATTRPARRPQPSWLDGVVRSGPVAIGLAVVAAAASFLIFSANQRDLDVTVVSSVDTVEVDP